VSTPNAYQSLAEVHEGDARWAFGAGPADGRVAEVAAPVPPGVDPTDLSAYCLMLGDDALVCSHRLTEWISNAPELEEEVALANIALDLLGQARLLLARAGQVEVSPDGTAPDGTAPDEDRLAFWRAEVEFRNVALVEVDDERDFARAIARLLLFSSWRLALLERLRGSRDPAIAAVAGRGVAELTYHRDYAVRWTLRLGDGTEESHTRMQAALEWVWPWYGELFRTSDIERKLTSAGVAVDPARTRAEVDAVLDQVLTAATLTRPSQPAAGAVGGRAGRDGVHTEALGHVLGQLQSLARQHPGATW
jgi:ring-1,2-phenylacetyl-CoA epoxidase subunit PaaC